MVFSLPDPRLIYSYFPSLLCLGLFFITKGCLRVFAAGRSKIHHPEASWRWGVWLTAFLFFLPSFTHAQGDVIPFFGERKILETTETQTFPGNVKIEGYLDFAGLSSAPTPAVGRIYYDNVLNTAYFYDGNSWTDVGEGGGASLWTDAVGYINPTTATGFQIADTTGDTTIPGSLTVGGNTAWHAGNDGSGSGLDADTVDGISSGSFLRSDAADTAAGQITFSTTLARGGHSVGFLEGSYNNIGANDAKSNPIYTIGSSYNPTDTLLSNMYGIGYSHDNFWTVGSGTTGWGLYVAADGDIRHILDASTGISWASGSMRAPLFYDSDNTGYYVDPASTSNMNAITAAGTVAANNGITVDGSTVIDDGAGWHRTYGATGWYNGTYEGGWYMTDTTWIQAYNNKYVRAAYFYSNNLALYATHGSGTAGYLTRWTGTYTQGNSIVQDNGTNVGIGMAPGQKLDVAGNLRASGNVCATNYYGNGSNLTGITGTPSGMIAMFDSACPSGWTEVTAFRNVFPRGHDADATYCETGGADTATVQLKCHSHELSQIRTKVCNQTFYCTSYSQCYAMICTPILRTYYIPTHYGTGAWNHCYFICKSTIIEDLCGGTTSCGDCTTPTISTIPAFREVVFCKKT